MTSKRGGRNNTQLSNDDENNSGGTRMLTIFICANNLS